MSNSVSDSAGPTRLEVVQEDEPGPGLSTISKAIEDIAAGKMVILVDDEDRENEGDLCMAADKVTPDRRIRGQMSVAPMLGIAPPAAPMGNPDTQHLASSPLAASSPMHRTSSETRNSIAAENEVKMEMERIRKEHDYEKNKLFEAELYSKRQQEEAVKRKRQQQREKLKQRRIRMSTIADKAKKTSGAATGFMAGLRRTTSHAVGLKASRHKQQAKREETWQRATSRMTLGANESSGSLKAALITERSKRKPELIGTQAQIPCAGTECDQIVIDLTGGLNEPGPRVIESPP